MADPTLPPSLAADLADLKRRLNNLERSQRLPFSSTKGGVFLFLDNDGNVRRAEGNVSDAGQPDPAAAYGFFLFGDQGGLLVAQKTGDKGLTYPNQKLALHDPTGRAVTSGSFITLWEDYVSQPVHEVISVEVAVTMPGGTTGELRLFDNLTNTATSAAAVDSNTAFVNFEWLHPSGVGAFATRNPSPDGNRFQANLQVAFQARRTAGAGVVTVFAPRVTELTSKTLHPLAASNGHPVVTTI